MSAIETNRKREVITSRNHPYIKRIRALQNRSERERSGQFFVEGTRFVAQAVQQGATIDTIIYAPDLLINNFAKRLVQTQRRSGIRCRAVAPDVLHSITLNDDPQGIGGIMRQQWTPLSTVDPTQGLCWVALDMVQSSGNLGTIVRTCEAVGAAGIILIGDNIDPYDPACVRASMAALFRQKFVRTTMTEFLRWKEIHNCLLVGTSPGAAHEYDAADYRSPTVLFMGWERKGLSHAQQKMCDIMVRLPMTGQVDSLNLAVATGVMLYEVLRQRRHIDEVGRRTEPLAQS